MSARFTEADLERAYAVVRNTTACTDKVAQLIADVREECAKRLEGLPIVMEASHSEYVSASDIAILAQRFRSGQ